MSALTPPSSALAWAALEEEVRYGLERNPRQVRSKLALLLAQSRHDPHWRTRGIFWSARLHYAVGRYAHAQRLFERILEQDPETDLSDEAREELGYAYQSQGKLGAALGQFQTLLERGSQPRRETQRAAALEGLAVVYHYLEDRAASLNYQLQSLELRRALGDPDKLALCLSNLSADYEKLGNLELATGFAQNALLLARETRNVRVEAVALNNLGESLLHHQPRQALASFQTLLELAEQLPSPKYLVWAHTGLGKGYLALNQPERALLEFGHSLELSGQHSLLAEQLETRLSMLSLLTTQNALHTLLEGLEQSRAGGFEALEAQFERQLSATLEGLGHFEEALEHLKLFLALEERREKRRSQQQAEVLAVRFAAETYRREALEWRQQNHTLEQEMRLDPLTRLPNRRWLDEILDAAHLLALESNSPLCVAVLDIDFFKQVNDQFTHHMGDKVLRELARVLERHLPHGATVARYGGEEFVMVFPGQRLLEALVHLQNLLEEVEKYGWTALHQELTLTLSAGVAEMTVEEDARALLARADEQLFEAKRQGRNRVIWEKQQVE